MHWVMQENKFSEHGFDDAIEVFKRFDIPYSVHTVVPFVGEIIPDINPEGPVICIGSYAMRHLAKQKNWTPGVFDLIDVDFNVQSNFYGKENMLNGDAVVSKFKDAVIEGDRAFIRPTEDTKVFAGKVFSKQELIDWQKLILDMGDDHTTSLTGDTMIQLSSVKQIYAEYRFWIVDNKIVTQSLYKRGDTVVYSRDVDQHVVAFVRDMIYDTILLLPNYSTWRPHDAYVIDVCDTPEGMKVVELNTINASGFYAANMTDLIMALEHYGERFKHREV